MFCPPRCYRADPPHTCVHHVNCKIYRGRRSAPTTLGNFKGGVFAVNQVRYPSPNKCGMCSAHERENCGHMCVVCHTRADGKEGRRLRKGSSRTVRAFVRSRAWEDVVLRHPHCDPRQKLLLMEGDLLCLQSGCVYNNNSWLR